MGVFTLWITQLHDTYPQKAGNLDQIKERTRKVDEIIKF